MMKVSGPHYLRHAVKYFDDVFKKKHSTTFNNIGIAMPMMDWKNLLKKIKRFLPILKGQTK